MTGGSSSQEYLINLYNGYSAVAERVDRLDLQNIHIKTSLDECIGTWIQDGNDIILTGNPGDGKTHLIEILRVQHQLDQADVETDASQKKPDDLLRTWQHNKDNNIPLVLAINHAPLRTLSVSSKAYPVLAYLQNLQDEIENLVYYSDPKPRSFKSTIVVDLSQRELLIHSIISKLAKKLSQVATTSPCEFCPPKKCPVEYNAKALSNDRIISNLVMLLSLVSRRGFHATMRDLAGLIAFMLTGGQSCATRWKPYTDEEGNTIQPKYDSYTYYNLLFTGRGRFFDAICAIFDPGEYPEPQSDLDLWDGQIQTGWFLQEPIVTSPATLADLRSLKRRYFFEHDHDTGDFLNRVLPVTEKRFNNLMAGYYEDKSAVEDLVDMINTFYSPHNGRQRDDDKYRLRLWNSHRYSVGNTPGYVAMRSLPSDKLTVYYPKVSPHLEGAVEARRDHVMLAVKGYTPGAPALRIDWTLYQSLIAAQSGAPMVVQPFHILRRLDLFLRSLGMDVGGLREIETIEWGDYNHRQRRSIKVNRIHRRYE